MAAGSDDQETLSLPVTCRVYATIRESQNQRGKTICGLRARRMNVFVSSNSRVEVRVLLQTNRVGNKASAAATAIAAASDKNNRQQLKEKQKQQDLLQHPHFLLSYEGSSSSWAICYYRSISASQIDLRKCGCMKCKSISTAVPYKWRQICKFMFVLENKNVVKFPDT